MEALYITIPISLLLALSFLIFFVFSVKNGQFDELENHKTKIFDISFKNEKRKEDEN